MAAYVAVELNFLQILFIGLHCRREAGFNTGDIRDRKSQKGQQCQLLIFIVCTPVMEMSKRHNLFFVVCYERDTI